MVTITEYLKRRHKAMDEQLTALGEKDTLTDEEDHAAGELLPRVEELGHIIEELDRWGMSRTEYAHMALFRLIATGNATAEELDSENIITSELIDRVLERNGASPDQLDHLANRLQQIIERDI